MPRTGATAVFAVATGDVAELQGRFVIVPRCLIRGSIDRAGRVGTPVHGQTVDDPRIGAGKGDVGERISR